MAPWPLPQRFESGSTTLWLSPEVQFVHYVKLESQHEYAAWYKELQKAQLFVLVRPIDLDASTDLVHFTKGQIHINLLHHESSITLKIFSMVPSNGSN